MRGGTRGGAPVLCRDNSDLDTSDICYPRKGSYEAVSRRRAILDVAHLPRPPMAKGGWREMTKMRALELFAGTGSIGRAFERLGWDVVSLDIDSKCQPTHAADVLSWDYRIYPSNYFDFVWDSPVCQHYSIARTTGGPRDLLSADRLVRRALQIITYYGCNWCLSTERSS